MLWLCIAFGSTVAAEMRDRNNDGVVDVLVPIVVRGDAPVPGAYGSRWSTEVWIHNGSDEPLRFIQRSWRCPIILTCDPQVPRGVTMPVTTVDGPVNAGAMYYVPAVLAEEITFEVRLLELSRRAQPNGIELPVVWEDDFRTKPTRLIAVPRGEHLRTALRLYDPRRAGMTFDVEIIGASGETLATTRVLAADPADPTMAIHDDHLPFVAFLPDVEALIPATIPGQRYDIRVKPVSGGEYWAFSSVTDRDTQHVLIITPDN